eukprot:TRINITY_DN4908_c0_g1_i1.p1 TRINITY_DN4908_c0_g1~~TRINITY_DN4908_c0_g1_i1.p1  ORF type:complete len:751 (+),score=245.90 TRINITY_DN4908_c0_g1_i1:117-2369(+)
MPPQQMRMDLHHIAVDLPEPPEAWSACGAFAEVAVEARSVSVGQRPLGLVVARLVHDLLRVGARCDEFGQRALSGQQRLAAELGEQIRGVAESCERSAAARLEETSRQLMEQLQSLHCELQDAQAQLAVCRAGLERAHSEQQGLAAGLREQGGALRELIAEQQQELAEVRQQQEAAAAGVAQDQAQLDQRVQTVMRSVVAKQRCGFANVIQASTQRTLRKVYWGRLCMLRAARRKRARQRAVVGEVVRLTIRGCMQACFRSLLLWRGERAAQRRARQVQEARARHMRVVTLGAANQLRRRALHQWLTWTRSRRAFRQGRVDHHLAAVRALQQLVRSGDLRYWFGLLAGNRRRKRVQREQLRKCEVVASLTTRSHKQAVFDRWMAFMRMDRARRKKKSTADHVLQFTTRGLRQRYFNKWSIWRLWRVNRLRLRTVAERVLAHSSRALKEKWYLRWKAFRDRHLAKKIRGRLAEALSGRMPQQLKLTYFTRWGEYRLRVAERQKAQQRRRRLDIQGEALLLRYARLEQRRYFTGWLYSTQGRSRARSLAEVRSAVEQLRGRSDAMWAQLEFAQKTVGNTNSCVQRLVDRLISVDESLDRLDKDKAGRRELQLIVDTSAGAPVSALSGLDADLLGAAPGAGEAAGSRLMLGSLSLPSPCRAAARPASADPVQPRWADAAADGGAGRSVFPPPGPPPVRSSSLLGGGGAGRAAARDGAAVSPKRPVRRPADLAARRQSATQGSRTDRGIARPLS